ncbi:MAG: hypothetical protein ABIH89_00980 [Elusimicrobiota bacterium]
MERKKGELSGKKKIRRNYEKPKLETFKSTVAPYVVSDCTTGLSSIAESE